jgi:putative acetyltransferase
LIRVAEDLGVVRELFREYQAGVDAPVCFASFDAELAGLPAPYFAILVAEVNGGPAGCVALKSLGGGVAEVKRLYVRGAFRRFGLGEQLMRAAIAAARDAGYETVRLDTLPFMAPAIALYARLGFVRIPRYNDNPDPDALFFELGFPK